MFNAVSTVNIRGFVCATMLALAAGCGRGSSAESFHPAEDAAEEALTSALTFWQNGQTKEELSENTDPEVQVAEPKWDAGSKLKHFEILEALPGAMPRKFSVQITLEGATAPENVTYVVIGKDPLWVMSEQEYARGDM
jgi:hypothetical protein